MYISLPSTFCINDIHVSVALCVLKFISDCPLLAHPGTHWEPLLVCKVCVGGGGCVGVCVEVTSYLDVQLLFT